MLFLERPRADHIVETLILSFCSLSAAFIFSYFGGCHGQTKFAISLWFRWHIPLYIPSCHIFRLQVNLKLIL